MDLFAYVDVLSREVDRGWSAADHDRGAFPDIAADVLHRLGTAEIDAGVFLTSVLSRPLPPQTNYASRFGQPPVTLYQGQDFYIEALYWFDGTTAIHEHAFAGAFQVLVGGSIHVRHDFETHRRWSERLESGTLRAVDSEVLRRGDVRRIDWGREGIHSLFHLERPSVTLVVRTSLGEGRRQLTFCRAGLAYDPFFTDEVLGRRLQALSALHAIDPARAYDSADSMLVELDHMRGLLVLLRMFRHDKGSYHADLTAEYERRIGTDGLVGAAFAEMAIESGIMARRQVLRDPKHRLYLAIVLNVVDHADRLRLVGQLFPDGDPGDTIAEIVGELASRDLRGISGMVLSPLELEALQSSLRRGGSIDLTATLSDRSRAQELVKALVTPAG